MTTAASSLLSPNKTTTLDSASSLQHPLQLEVPVRYTTVHCKFIFMHKRSTAVGETQTRAQIFQFHNGPQLEKSLWRHKSSSSSAGCLLTNLLSSPIFIFFLSTILCSSFSNKLWSVFYFSFLAITFRCSLLQITAPSSYNSTHRFIQMRNGEIKLSIAICLQQQIPQFNPIIGDRCCIGMALEERLFQVLF